MGMHSTYKTLMQRTSRTHFLLAILVLLIAFFTIASSGRFLRIPSIQSMLYQIPEFDIFALGMHIVILTGGINLSLIMLGNVSVGLSAALTHAMFGGEPASNFLYVCTFLILSMCFALVGGMLNGTLIAYLQVTPLLVTLGSLTLFEGCMLVLTKGGSISQFPAGYDYVGSAALFGILPLSLAIMLLLYGAWHNILKRRVLGAHIIAVGSSEKVSSFSGINTKKIIMIVYISSALLGCMGALIMASRYNSIKETYGISYLLQSIAAVMLGGTSIYGGRGSLLGTLIAITIFQVISSGFSIIGFNRYLTLALVGFILLIALLQDRKTAKAS